MRQTNCHTLSRLNALSCVQDNHFITVDFLRATGSIIITELVISCMSHQMHAMASSVACRPHRHHDLKHAISVEEGHNMQHEWQVCRCKMQPRCMLYRAK